MNAKEFFDLTASYIDIHDEYINAMRSSASKEELHDIAIRAISISNKIREEVVRVRKILDKQ